MKIFKRILFGLLIVAVIAALGFVFWANNAAQPSDVALQALKSDAQVTVTQHDGYITFEPVGAQTATGFIFYPGGRVDYRAYSPVLHKIAAHGYFVAVVHEKLNLAFFDLNAADKVVAQYPAIEHWAVGGHSLGGVGAASYASKHLDVLDGLVFWASYPANDSLKKATIKVVSIYGTNDMAGMESFDQSRSQLPADTQFVVIDGGNHGQFGDYGFQSGDNEASISRADQQQQVVYATVKFLELLSQ